MEELIRACRLCKQNKPIDEFSWRHSGESRIKTCKECQQKYQRQHYLDNKDIYKERATLSNKKIRQQIREYLNDIKSSPCVDCGVSYPPYVMDFDHLRDKKFNISQAARKGVKMQYLLDELSNCELVCSNCHRIRTFNRSGLV